MRPLRALVVLPSLSLLTSVVAALLLANAQTWLGHCDPKFGCAGGVQLAVLFAAVAALGLGLVFTMFLLAFASMRSVSPPARLGKVISITIGLLAALYTTWPAWRYGGT